MLTFIVSIAAGDTFTDTRLEPPVVYIENSCLGIFLVNVTSTLTGLSVMVMDCVVHEELRQIIKIKSQIFIKSQI